MKRTNTKKIWVSYGCIFRRVHSALIDVLDDVIVLRCVGLNVYFTLAKSSRQQSVVIITEEMEEVKDEELT